MQRPASVNIFGVLNFVFAAFAVIGLMASVTLFSLPGDPSDPVIKLLHENASYAVWLKICIPLGVLSCAALLAAGVGLLSFKPWGRTLSIAYAIYAIVFVVVGMGVNLILMIQPLSEPAPRRAELAAAGAIGGPLSGTVGGLFWVVYPILMLVLMLRPKMAAAFRLPAPPQA
jgi:hypothetical protein